MNAATLMFALPSGAVATGIAKMLGLTWQTSFIIGGGAVVGFFVAPMLPRDLMFGFPGAMIGPAATGALVAYFMTFDLLTPAAVGVGTLFLGPSLGSIVLGPMF